LAGAKVGSLSLSWLGMGSRFNHLYWLLTTYWFGRILPLN